MTTNKVKRHIGFHYLLAVIQLRALILLACISQQLLSKIKNKQITHNIFRIQSDNSIMCESFCIAFIEYMIAGKALLDNTKEPQVLSLSTWISLESLSNTL